MTKEILVNATNKEVRIAFLEKNILQEIFIERLHRLSIVGNIYKGKVTRVLPGIQAAFINIDLEKAGFLHVSDITHDMTLEINDVIHVGEEVLVQVLKDPLGSKGARLTTFITLPSRHLVLTPNSFQVTVSQKIETETERARLLALTEPSEEGGYIFRTIAEGVTEVDLKNDKIYLQKLWKEISQRIKKTNTLGLIYEEIPLVLRMLRDLPSDEFVRIRVDDLSTFQKMQTFTESYIPHLTNILEKYTDPRPIFDVLGVEEEIQKSLERKVNLKSGGYLVFDQTEAMTTIDVNTGSYTGHKNLALTIYNTNLEAVDVIARQLRLRNLGGMIIIDFIDMQDDTHKTNLMSALSQVLAKDSVRVEISEISNLGLVQLTRKRTRESLENILCVTCPVCHQRGMIKSFETVAYEIFRKLQRNANLFTCEGLLVLASQSMIDYLFKTELTTISELEKQLNKGIKLQVEDSYSPEQYDILPLSERE